MDINRKGRKTMLNENTYPAAMKNYSDWETLEKLAKQEKERFRDELIEYMKKEGKTELTSNGLKANYTTYTEKRFNKSQFEKKAPKTFQYFFGLYFKIIEKERFTCK